MWYTFVVLQLLTIDNGKSIFSKVENSARVWEHFQIIMFRLGQQVRVPWRLERPNHRHSTLCVFICVSDGYFWEKGKQNYYVKGFSFDHKIQQVPCESLVMTCYISYFKKFEVEKYALRLDTLSCLLYVPRYIPLLSEVLINGVHSFTYWINLTREPPLGLTSERQLRSNFWQLWLIFALFFPLFLFSFAMKRDNFIATWQNGSAGSPSCSCPSCLRDLIT